MKSSLKLDPVTARKIGRGALWIGIIMCLSSVYIIWTQPLWEKSTLFLFTGIWLIITGALLNFREQFSNYFRYFALSTGAGLLMAFGFPPSPAFPLIFVAFVPIFYLERARYKKEISQWPFFWFVFNSFLLWNIWSTFWIANSALAPAVFAIVVNALLMTLTVLWVNWIHRKSDVDWYFGLVFIAGWLIFEFMHLRWDLSWPWLNLGNALAAWPVLAQWYEYSGTLGGTLWILYVNYLLFSFLFSGKKISKKLSAGGWLRLGLWILVPPVLSLFIYFNTSTEGRQIKAVVVNPNVEPHYEKFTQGEEEKWAVYERLLKEALSYEPAVILFPETIFDRVNVADPQLHPQIERMNAVLDQENSDARILLGVTAFRIFEGESVPDRPSIRESRNQSDGHVFHWEVYNSAILLGNDTVPVYHKQKLVPGAEIFPYRQLLPFLNPLVDQLGGSIFGFGRPASQNVFEFEDIRLSPIICYESIYGQFTRKYIADGANLLGIITNDGWWGNTAGYRQHDRFAALRAIEYRRDVLRSANMGRSGAFDILGRPLVQTNKYGEEAVIPVDVTLHERVTFYAIWGDFLGRFSIFLMIFFTLKAGVNMVTKSKS